LPRYSLSGGATTYVHRGGRGANLKRRARDAWFRRTCGLIDFDKPRCREASRSVGPVGFGQREARRSAPLVLSQDADKDGNEGGPGAFQTIRALSRGCLKFDHAIFFSSWFETHSLSLVLLTMRITLLLFGNFNAARENYFAPRRRCWPSPMFLASCERAAA
jgi:hypothetical protein